jgi:hypothetical protein
VDCDQLDGSSDDGSHDPGCTSRDPVAPAIPPTTTASRAAPHRVTHHRSGNRPPSIGIGGFQHRRAIELVAGRPPLSKADSARAGKNHHVHQRQHGDNGDSGRLKVVPRLLESNNDKRWNKVDLQQEKEGGRVDRARVPRSVPIPRRLPDAIHDATLSAHHLRSAERAASLPLCEERERPRNPRRGRRAEIPKRGHRSRRSSFIFESAANRCTKSLVAGYNSRHVW